MLESQLPACRRAKGLEVLRLTSCVELVQSFSSDEDATEAEPVSPTGTPVPTVSYACLKTFIGQCTGTCHLGSACNIFTERHGFCMRICKARLDKHNVFACVQAGCF